jgi:uncharacterized protein
MDLDLRLRDDLHEAIRARDEPRKSAIRALKAAVAQSAERGGQSDESQFLHLVRREVMKRMQAITEYEEASRPDLADLERQQVAVLEGYLPPRLTTEELLALIDAVVNSTSAGVRDVGRVMKALAPQIRGRTEMGSAKELVQERLQRPERV